MAQLLKYLLVLLILFTGCASLEQLSAVTTFTPTGRENGWQYYHYTAIAGPSYPLNDSGESARLHWLRKRLILNHLAPDSYEITSREYICSTKGLLGESGRVHYTVRVPVKNNSGQ